MPPRARGRAACNQCRSRKQKCDEKRPICSRCAELNKPCQWPGLKRRGPAKGYTEALEQRLSATENVLLRLLSVTDIDTMQSAFAEYNDPQIQEHQSTTTNKAELAIYWEQFPLSNVEDVVTWASQYCINPNTSGQIASSGVLGTHAGQLARTPSFRSHEVATGAAHRTVLPDNRAADLTLPQNSVDFMQGDIATRDQRVQVQKDSSEALLQDSFEVPEQFREQYIW